MTRDEIVSFIEEEGAKPFEWGKSDCVQFAAAMVKRASGRERVIATYSTEAEANAIRDAAGGLQKLVEAELGPMQRDIQNCPDGAVVLTAFDAGQALGVALPPRFFLRTTQGVRPVHLELAIGYWPCPLS